MPLFVQGCGPQAVGLNGVYYRTQMEPPRYEKRESEGSYAIYFQQTLDSDRQAVWVLANISRPVAQVVYYARTAVQIDYGSQQGDDQKDAQWDLVETPRRLSDVPPKRC